jgi:hypothetical protein
MEMAFEGIAAARAAIQSRRATCRNNRGALTAPFSGNFSGADE